MVATEDHATPWHITTWLGTTKRINEGSKVALRQSELVEKISEAGGSIQPNLVRRVLKELAGIAAAEIAAGEDFTVPGVAKVTFKYRKPQKKGARWKKGDTRVNNITKEESIAETDSPEVKAQVRVVALPMPAVKKPFPKSTDKASQTQFLSTKAGKNIAGRKG